MDNLVAVFLGLFCTVVLVLALFGAMILSRQPVCIVFQTYDALAFEQKISECQTKYYQVYHPGMQHEQRTEKPSQSEE